MDLPQLSVGVKHMLDYAIHQHRKTHQGLYPQRFELHPALLPRLFTELGPPPLWQGEGPLNYQRVPIIVTEHAHEPRLITCRNEVEYL